MRMPLFQVDAFTARPFRGNPAAVCPLETWLDDATLQAIAAENNLSETAYLVERGEGYDLRWFTPAMEVDLCGHATLAAAKVIFERLRPGTDHVRFDTRSGALGVARRGAALELDFPTQPGEACDPPPGLFAALGGEPVDVRRSVHSYLVAYGTEAEVRALEPSADGLLRQDRVGFIATAPGDEVDFVVPFLRACGGASSRTR